MPTWFSMNFQDSGSPFMVQLSYFHDYIMIFIVFIVVFIFYLMVYLSICSSFYKYFSESTMIETIWSLIPAFFLIFLVLPSMQILYLMEDLKFPHYSLKVVGHQWYWSYVVPMLNNLVFSFNGVSYSFCEYDSLMDLDSDKPRLLGCTSSLNFPVNLVSRILVSSSDVIHSFAVPSLGLKVDSVPGRINQIFFLPSRIGLFFGQCSEICGSNHSFMPINVQVGSVGNYNSSNVSMILEELFPIGV